MEKEEQYFLKHMMDLANQAYMTNRPVVSSFLNLYEQSLFLSMQQKPDFYCNFPLPFSWWGGYEMAERKRLLFAHSIAKKDFQIAILQIQPQHPKYAVSMNHRDFLGSILNLGLKRETIGDILIEGQSAYVFCQMDMATFICENLSFVKNNVVTLGLLANLTKNIEPKLTEETGSVSSLRIDCVIALAFHLSRKQAQELINRELVFIDSRLIKHTSILLKEGQTISVRGKGKCIFSHIVSTTKKGNLWICLKRYQS